MCFNSLPSLQITHCNFEPEHIEILVVDEGCGLSELKIAEEIISRLSINNIGKIRVRKLKQKATFTETTMYSGDTARGFEGKQGTIGAFVEVEGK